MPHEPMVTNFDQFIRAIKRVIELTTYLKDLEVRLAKALSDDETDFYVVAGRVSFLLGQRGPTVRDLVTATREKAEYQMRINREIKNGRHD